MPAISIIPKDDKRPARFGWAPGNYLGICGCCDEQFIGAKRAIMCANCAYDRPESEKPKLVCVSELIGRATRVLKNQDDRWAVGDLFPLLRDMRDALQGPKRPSIELLEAEVERLKAREQDLLETNNRYLERARLAEGILERNGFNKAPFAKSALTV